MREESVSHDRELWWLCKEELAGSHQFALCRQARSRCVLGRNYAGFGDHFHSVRRVADVWMSTRPTIYANWLAPLNSLNRTEYLHANYTESLSRKGQLPPANPISATGLGTKQIEPLRALATSRAVPARLGVTEAQPRLRPIISLWQRSTAREPQQ